jgi:Transmembrane secretion effector
MVDDDPQRESLGGVDGSSSGYTADVSVYTAGRSACGHFRTAAVPYRRRNRGVELLGIEVKIVDLVISVLIAIFATVVTLGLATPGLLLLTTCLLSAAWSLAAPAWLSITPRLVPRQDLDSAVAANNVGYNVSRAVGPALGGVAIAGLGIAAPFWIFGACNVGTVAA